MLGRNGGMLENLAGLKQFLIAKVLSGPLLRHRLSEYSNALTTLCTIAPHALQRHALILMASQNAV